MDNECKRIKMLVSLMNMIRRCLCDLEWWFQYYKRTGENSKNEDCIAGEKQCGYGCTGGMF